MHYCGLVNNCSWKIFSYPLGKTLSCWPCVHCSVYNLNLDLNLRGFSWMFSFYLLKKTIDIIITCTVWWTKLRLKDCQFCAISARKNNFHTVHVLVGDILQIYIYVLFIIIFSWHYPEVWSTKVPKVWFNWTRAFV